MSFGISSMWDQLVDAICRPPRYGKIRHLSYACLRLVRSCNIMSLRRPSGLGPVVTSSGLGTAAVAIEMPCNVALMLSDFRALQTWQNKEHIRMAPPALCCRDVYGIEQLAGGTRGRFTLAGRACIRGDIVLVRSTTPAGILRPSVVVQPVGSFVKV